MLKIGDFSKLSRITIRMLRHYDEIGLLRPEYVDDFTGYRYYSESQLPLAGRIQVLKNLGFGLSVIGEILKRYEDAGEMEQFLLVKKEELVAAEKNIKTQLRLIDSTIDWLRKDGKILGYDVSLKTLPARYVASVRQIIPSYNDEGMLWQILQEDTAALSIQDGNPCYTMAIFHNGEYKENDIDVEVQKSVIGSYPNTGRVQFKTMPAVEIASATYKGSYDLIGQVNEAVARWIKDNGYDFNGLAFNIYHVSPHETTNPDEYVTEVCYPVKKKV